MSSLSTLMFSGQPKHETRESPAIGGSTERKQVKKKKGEKLTHIFIPQLGFVILIGQIIATFM